MILDKIAADTKVRIAIEKKRKPLSQVKEEAVQQCAKMDFPFEHALRQPGISFICEIKRASPSQGTIAAEFPYLEIAKEYQAAGAAAISVLTEPNYFNGRDCYLEETAGAVDLPILRKDFTIDEYQIYQAKLLGAAAVLLICALLKQEQLREYIRIAHRLGLSALVEAHTPEEVRMALAAGARIIGVNNRDLQTFVVDLDTSLKLRSMVPEDRIYISESGIRTPGDIEKLRDWRIDAVLIGETLMRSPDKKARLEQLRGR